MCVEASGFQAPSSTHPPSAMHRSSKSGMALASQDRLVQSGRPKGCPVTTPTLKSSALGGAGVQDLVLRGPLICYVLKMAKTRSSPGTQLLP